MRDPETPPRAKITFLDIYSEHYLSHLPELLHSHIPEPATDKGDRITWSWTWASAYFLQAQGCLKIIQILVKFEVAFGKKGGMDRQSKFPLHQA